MKPDDALNVRCTKCIDSCSHMKKFNINPKNYTRQIIHNEDIIHGYTVRQ